MEEEEYELLKEPGEDLINLAHEDVQMKDIHSEFLMSATKRGIFRQVKYGESEKDHKRYELD